MSLFFKSFFIDWFTLKSGIENLSSQPWTLITHAFIHNNLLHILSNLFVLYFIGNLFLDFFSKKQFLNLYFLGILSGGIAFLTYYFITKNTGFPLGGASAAVTAIFVAITVKIPHYSIRLRLIGSIELWVLTAIWIVLSLLELSTANKGSSIAHLGGALIGFVYAKQLERGMDIGKWVESTINFFSNLFKQKKHSPLRTVHKKQHIKRKPTHKEVNQNQQQINKILDKIGKSGYESLNKEEKEFLFKSGNKK
ncbi:MAG: rhomboid family intramembrane serine protease [Lutibacter sp.]|nr:MAG: rhomboid family intramembrane serine protease [Lutibacter sp.]